MASATAILAAMREPGEPSKPSTSGPESGAPEGTMMVERVVLRITPSVVEPMSALGAPPAPPSRPITSRSVPEARSTIWSSATPETTSQLASTPSARARSAKRRETASARER